MYSTSWARPRSGLGGASAGTLRAWRSSMTGAQNDASAKPPCTRTTVGVSGVLIGAPFHWLSGSDARLGAECRRSRPSDDDSSHDCCKSSDVVRDTDGCTWSAAASRPSPTELAL